MFLIPMNPDPWSVQLLGSVHLRGPDGLEQRPERKLAAVLAYLALEGATGRGRLAGLLWPDSPEPTARNNLSQLLRKLRLFAGVELVTGGDLLELAPGVTVDAARMRGDFARGRTAELLAAGGELLAGLSYDDCPDLDDWVTAERARLTEWRGLALRSDIARQERAGDYAAALLRARALLDLDPVSEEAWRHVIRLHYLSGDRPAALRAYHRCKEVLRRELQTEPLPETVQLAREIDRGSVPVPARAPSVALPLAVLRPPHLIGREAEWARLDEAWERGQMIYVEGDPGVGKTRLVTDFAASKGAFLEFRGRPGDLHQPFTSSARNYRMLAQHPAPGGHRVAEAVDPCTAPAQAGMSTLAQTLDLLTREASSLAHAWARSQGVARQTLGEFDQGHRDSGLHQNVQGDDGLRGSGRVPSARARRAWVDGPVAEEMAVLACGLDGASAQARTGGIRRLVCAPEGTGRGLPGDLRPSTWRPLPQVWQTCWITPTLRAAARRQPLRCRVVRAQWCGAGPLKGGRNGVIPTLTRLRKSAVPQLPYIQPAGCSSVRTFQGWWCGCRGRTESRPGDSQSSRPRRAGRPSRSWFAQDSPLTLCIRAYPKT